VLLAAAIERLYDLNVGTTPLEEGAPHEKPHKPILFKSTINNQHSSFIIHHSSFNNRHSSFINPISSSQTPPTSSRFRKATTTTPPTALHPGKAAGDDGSARTTTGRWTGISSPLVPA